MAYKAKAAAGKTNRKTSSRGVLRSNIKKGKTQMKKKGYSKYK